MTRLVDAARGYLDVRWRHRGRSRFGLDCAGLVVVAYRDCGIDLPDYKLYGRHPFQDGLLKHARAALGLELPAGAELRHGDVLLLRFDREPHHMAIVAGVEYAGQPALNIVHSDGHVGRVIEQRLTPDMKARITHLFRRTV